MRLAGRQSLQREQNFQSNSGALIVQAPTEIFQVKVGEEHELMLHHPLPERGHARGANIFVAITEAMRENVSEDVVHVTFHQLDVFLRAFDLAL